MAGKSRRGAPQAGDGDDDGALWRQVTESVRPLKNRPKPIAQPASHPASPKPVAKTASRKPARPSPPAPIALKPMQRPTPPLEAGIDKRTADRLRKGQLQIDGRLDLHGMDRESAHQALRGFIARAHAAGKRCVLVVTGKGKGILQSETPRWLAEPDLRSKIVSTRPAQPKDGGTGALYVLLKRHRS